MSRGLAFWKALAAFELQPEEVLMNREWRSKFPKVYEQLDALMDSPPPAWGKVWIPYAMLVEMAKVTRVLFFVSREWLIGTNCREAVPAEFEEITPLEALECYGPEHVFEATDKSGSYLGDRRTLYGSVVQHRLDK